MTDTHAGRCFCGAVEIEAAGAPLEMGYCHCDSCRAYSGCPVTTYMLWHADKVRVTKGAELIGRFNKTGMSDRQFCTQCGGHIMTNHPEMGFIDVHAAVMSSPAFAPTLHLNYGEAVQPMQDGLPKLKDFPAHAGGSGETLPE